MATFSAVSNALVGIVMGSASDLDVMRPAAEVLDQFGVAREVRVISAHRTPREAMAYSEEAAGRGMQVIIAGAGGAAHLPGVLAACTPLPVIGVPVALRQLDGLDSLLSIVQMPAGVPVATVSIGGAGNAGLLAVRILALSDPKLAEALDAFRVSLAEKARVGDAQVRNELGATRPERSEG
jgi:5-(carboxyamino)imidazole ribonucleotide mutase